MMLQDYKDFAEYIIKNYPHARKIVEVGVGKEFSVCEELKRNLKNTEILATDVQASMGAVSDDASSPRMEMYKDADLIYSIRPPPELYEYIEKLAREIGADLLIRPLSSDFVKPRNAKLVNHGKASFYFIKNI